MGNQTKTTPSRTFDTYMHKIWMIFFAGYPCYISFVLHALRIFDFCSVYGNARHWSNYLNEDFVGRIKRMVVNSHPWTVSTRVLEKCTMSVCLRWAGPHAFEA